MAQNVMHLIFTIIYSESAKNLMAMRGFYDKICEDHDEEDNVWRFGECCIKRK